MRCSTLKSFSLLVCDPLTKSYSEKMLFVGDLLSVATVQKSLPMHPKGTNIIRPSTRQLKSSHATKDPTSASQNTQQRTDDKLCLRAQSARAIAYIPWSFLLRECCVRSALCSCLVRYFVFSGALFVYQFLLIWTCCLCIYVFIIIYPMYAP